MLLKLGISLPEVDQKSCLLCPLSSTISQITALQRNEGNAENLDYCKDSPGIMVIMVADEVRVKLA